MHNWLQFKKIPDLIIQWACLWLAPLIFNRIYCNFEAQNKAIFIIKYIAIAIQSIPHRSACKGNYSSC